MNRNLKSTPVSWDQSSHEKSHQLNIVQSMCRVFSEFSEHGLLSDVLWTFQRVLCFLQELSFPLSCVFPWNQERLGWLQRVLLVIRFRFSFATSMDPSLSTSSSSSLYLTAYFLFSFQSVALVSWLYVVLRYRYQHVLHHSFILTCINIAFQIGLGLLYIPTVSISALFFLTSYNPFLLFLMSLFLLILILFAYIYKSTVLQWWPKSTALAARPHSYTVGMMWIAKSVTSFLFSLLEPSAPQQLPIRFFLCCWLFFYYTFISLLLSYEVPFYKCFTNRFYIAGYSVCSWASLCLFLTLMVEDPQDTGSAWLFLMGSVVIIPSSLYLSDRRFRKLGKVPIHRITSSVDADSKIRMLLQKMHQEQEADMTGLEKTSKSSQPIPGMEVPSESQIEIEKALNLFNTRFPDGTYLYYTWSAYALGFLNNHILSMSKLRYILSTHSGHWLHFMVCHTRLQYLIHKSYHREEKDSDMNLLLGYKRMQKVCSMNMISCLFHQIQFWRLFLSRQASVTTLTKLAADIDQSRTMVKEYLDKLVIAHPNNAIYRFMYAQYLLRVIHNQEGAVKHIRKGKELEAVGMEVIEEDLVLQATDGMVVMCGDYDRMGEILYVNDALSNLVGYAAKELTGKNISVLMTKAFAEEHNDHIYKYTNTGQSTMLKKRRPLILKHALGHILTVSIQAFDYTRFSQEPNISFLGILRKIPEQKNIIIVNGNDGTLVEVSGQFSVLFPVDFHAMRNGDLFMEDLVSNYDECMPEVMKELEDNDGCIVCFEEHKGREGVALNFHFQYLPSVEKSKNLLLVTIEREENEVIPTRPLMTKFRRGGTMSRSDLKLRVSDMFSGMETELLKENSCKDIYEQLGRAPELLMAFTSINGVGGGDRNGFEETFELKRNVERYHNLEDKTVTRMNLTVVFTLVLTSLFAIVAQVVWESTVFAPFDQTLDLLLQETLLETVPTTCFYDSFIYNYLQWKIPGLNSSLETFRISNDMNQVNLFIDSFESYIQNSLIEGFSDIQTELYQATAVPITLPDGSIVTVNIMEALHYFAVAATLSSQIDQSLNYQVNDALYFFHINHDSSLTTSLNNAAIAFNSTQTNVNSMAHHISLSFVIAAISLILILSLVVFLPAIRNVERLYVDIFNFFASIPLTTIRDVLLSMTDKLSEMLEREEDLGSYQTTMETIQADTSWLQWAIKYGMDPKRPVFNTSLVTSVTLWNCLSRSYTLKIGAALLLVMIHFCALHIWWEAACAWDYNDMGARITALGHLPFLLRNLAFQLMQAQAIPSTVINNASSFNTSSIMAFVPTLNTSALIELRTELWNYEHAIVYGDPNFGIFNPIYVLPNTQQILVSQSICSLLTSPPISSTTSTSTSSSSNSTLTNQCVSLFHGLLVRGTHKTLLHLTQQIDQVIQSYSQFKANQTLPYISPTSINTTSSTFNTSVWIHPYFSSNLFSFILSIRNIIDNYLFTATTLVVQQAALEYKEQLAWITTGREAMTAGLVIINFFLLLLVFRPMKQQLNLDLKHFRALLMVIPNDILMASVILRRDLQNMVALFADASIQQKKL